MHEFFLDTAQSNVDTSKNGAASTADFGSELFLTNKGINCISLNILVF